jgi:hypothetical protein
MGIVILAIQVFILYMVFQIGKFTISNYNDREKIDVLRKNKSKRYKVYLKTFLYTTGWCLFFSLLYLGSDGSSCVSGDMYGCDEYSYDDEFVPRTLSDATRFFINTYSKILPLVMAGVYTGIWYEYKFYDGPEDNKLKKFINKIRNKILG